MTLKEKARQSYIELWAEFYITKDHNERVSLAGSLDFLQPFCADSPEEFKTWADRSVFMYSFFWNNYRQQMLEQIDIMIEQGNEEVARRQEALRKLIEGTEPGA